MAVIALAVVGAIGAMLLQRYVIVVATAFGGAWTMILAAATAVPQAAVRTRCGDTATCGFCIRPPAARHAMGADRVDRARRSRHGRAAGHHRRGAKDG